MQMKINATGIKAITKKLEKDAKAAQKVLKATTSDMSRRAPGKVADDVRTVYNIGKSEVTPTNTKSAKKPKRKAGTIKVKGDSVSSLEITYTGRVLTPTHFGMTPKKPPKRPKGKRRDKRKPITAQIKKGQRKALHSKAFLGSNGGSGYIPFKRTDAAIRRHTAYPIEAIKTVSLPQMVDNRNVQALIRKDINKMLKDRLDHHMKRFMK